MDLQKIQEVGCAVAKQAGAIHKKFFNMNIECQTKTSSYDLVTEVDIKTEKFIVEEIHKSFPGHNILAEEHQYDQTDSKYCWVIDPLDGTNNFAQGMPIFACSIALSYENEYAACGRAAGYWEFKLHPWDFAAGKLIVQEAGGSIKVTHMK